MSSSAAVGVDVSADPRTGEVRAQVVHDSAQRVQTLVDRAAQAAAALAGVPPGRRASWLDALADDLEEHAEDLVQLADSETALGVPRLTGELARTAAAARFYAQVARDGWYLDVAIDQVTAPAPATLRRLRAPLGPVAVFAASNFPFAFGVAGHDTCSALAAGCPVLLKGHSAQPLLSRRLAEVVEAALARSGAPDGAFAMVVGRPAGLALVDAPSVSAVGFTGSESGGMALVERSNRRPRPIPVYAEMGTVNPVVVTTAAARTRAQQIASGFVESFTLGAGQFCTKPGLLLVPAGYQLDTLVADEVARLPGMFLLTRGIAEAYRQGVTAMRTAGGQLAGNGGEASTGWAARPTVLTATAAALIPGSPLTAECFGPVAVVVEYHDARQRDQVLLGLQPSLAAAVAAGGADDPELPHLVSLLSAQVGRVVVDGWTTGVAASWAQHHGGPWPATSRAEATSVGAAAVDRFTRPITFQDVPDPALPPAVQDANPWGLPRRLDGVLQRPGESA